MKFTKEFWQEWRKNPEEVTRQTKDIVRGANHFLT